MGQQTYTTNVAIIGGGIAGIVSAIELLDRGIEVIIVDRDIEMNFGGLAREAFGGMALCGTLQQKLNGIVDNPEQLLNDWTTFGEMPSDDKWPMKWAEMYAYRNHEDIYCWLRQRDVAFFPAVSWVERGDRVPGNSVPRYHIIWGTGWGLMEALIHHLKNHPQADKLTLLFEHFVSGFEREGGLLTSCHGLNEATNTDFVLRADTFIAATGGINGSIDKVRENWPQGWPPPPDIILNGSHKYSDGILHDQVDKLGGNITHLDQQWNYAAGIRHPKPQMPDHGLSLLPPKSALWVDCYGKRIGPPPMVTGFDTTDLCRRVCEQDNGYTWQVLNKKIAKKEVSISGSEHNPSIRDKRSAKFLREIMFGNDDLYQYLTTQCPDVIVAYSLAELVDKMNALTGDGLVSYEQLRHDIQQYDDQLARGKEYQDDEQIRRINQLRQWKGDKIRTLKGQQILEKKAMPLIAMREYLISRKSMGGVQTDDHSRVQDKAGKVIDNLYAVGEMAGFGGGGSSGIR
ncbi:MAG: FAD-binding dehydrogenase, partial [Moraxellaceae bacterium]